MRMKWHDLLFAHWRADPRRLRELLPHGLELDLFAGEAWIGVVPFRMSDVAPRMLPAIPGLSAFPELNVRTYVTRDEKPGVFFFSLDATNPIAVRAARMAFYLPYMDARISLRNDADTYHYASQRTHRREATAEFVGSYRPTSSCWLSEPGTLEHWLTARYCLYAADRRHRVYRGEIDHPPWSLQWATCEIELNTMCAWLGLELSGPPHCLFAREIAVRAWLLSRCA